MRRRWAGLWSIGVVAAVAAPVLRGPGHDSFPLSTYPMFALDRGHRSVIDTAVATTSGGEELQLDPSRIGGSHEPVHAAATVSAAVANGSAARLCDEIAGRVAGRGPAAAAVEVVTVSYDPVAYFEGDHRPLERIVHATCPVKPSP